MSSNNRGLKALSTPHDSPGLSIIYVGYHKQLLKHRKLGQLRNVRADTYSSVSEREIDWMVISNISVSEQLSLPAQRAG